MALRYTMGKPVKGGPRTKATRELWEAAERARVMEDHPADCAICGGATDAAMVLEAHRRHLEALTAEWQAQEAARKAAAARYYDGGFRMVLAGAPIRVAAYVKDWAPWMKRALGRGTQPTHGASYQEVKEQAKALGLTEERLPTTYGQPERVAA